MQPTYVILPTNYEQDKLSRPLVVSLHSWSGNLEQRGEDLEAAADKRGWIYLFPNFRGRNDHPEACGSTLAQQDILDATEFAVQQYRVDRSRIYLTGASGGGHMTMLMAGRHPEPWAAASAWVGISDLAAWHQKHAKGGYGEMMRKSCGGAPQDSPKIDREYRLRSPLTHLHRIGRLPIDIAAGIHDGHTGSVPIRHSLLAFNEIAKAAKQTTISEREMQELSTPKGRLTKPLDTDKVVDASFGREIHLRRHCGASRVTIFEGGHEGIAEATISWLAQHRKK